MSIREDSATLGLVRKFIRAILVFGLIGTGLELVLLNHDEGLTQLVPLVLIALGLGVIGWHALSRTAGTLRLLRITMVGFILAGALGVILHSNGSAEFQKEIDPSIHGLDLFKKIIHSKTPPALAPGVMGQLGLLGLAFAFRHPDQEKNK